MHRLDRLTTPLGDARRAMTAGRGARAARRTLEHELAPYTSRADLVEWDAILARYDDNETAEIRTILHRRPVRG